MYNYKISKNRPGNNWFKVRDLKCFAWKSTEIKNYVNVFAPELNVITASDTFEDAPFALKDAIEISIEECDIWDFERTSIKEHELDKLPEDIVVFEFTMTLWVEMPELFIELIEFYEARYGIEECFCEQMLENPENITLVCEIPFTEIDFIFEFRIQKLEIEIYKFSMLETVSLTRDLVDKLKDPDPDELHEYLKCIN